MAAKKPCFRCGRQIDEWARICPFCNADQNMRADPSVEHEVPSIEIPVKRKTNPSDFFRTVAGRVTIGLGIALLLGGTFAIGTIVYSLGSASETAGRAAETRGPAPVGQTTDAVGGAPGGLTLVPAGAAVTSFEQSSPQDGQAATAPPGEPAGAAATLRRDATALSAEVYARMARAERLLQQRREQQLRNQTADPRTIEAPPAWAAGQRRQPPARQPETPAQTTTRQQESARQPEPERDDATVRRTPPVPVSQPIPSLGSVDRSGTVRLNLTVDARGRVREVEIVQGVPGITADLVNAVRRWRFRPATENGQAVEGMFPVEVSFNASDD